MNMKRSRAILSLALCCVGAAESRAQIVVTDGDDLAAIVAGAPDGETIRIDSNSTFSGTVRVSAKSLTLEAGPGFEPRIQGGADQPALVLECQDGATTDLIASGLTFEAGAGSPLVGAIDTEGALQSPATLLALFQECEFDGTAMFTSRPLFDAQFTLEDCHFREYARFGGAGSFLLGAARLSASVSRSSVEFGLSVDAFQDSDIDVEVLDSQVRFSVELNDLTNAGDYDVVLRRSHLIGGVSASGVDAPGHSVLVESCLLDGHSAVTETEGIQSTGSSRMRLVNCTLTGWEVALHFDPTSPSTGINLLLYDNDLDVDSETPSGALTHSLVSDGSYTGLGIVAGDPDLDGEGQFLPGSLGIDAGDSAASGLGLFDIAGKPRIQDGDEDGTPQVNFGAMESVNFCGLAGIEPLPGNGINPSGVFPAGPPIVGQDFLVQVQAGANTVLTVLAIDSPAPVPLLLPGITGEVLLAATPGMLLDYGVGIGQHVLPVPSSSLLCGATTGCQGLRVDLEPLTGALQIHALDAYLVTLGS